MKYKELIDLGFKHIEDNDPVWKNQYGYEYFRVEYKLGKRHFIDWNVQKQTCQVMKVDKEHNILAQWEITDLNLLKQIIKVFGPKDKCETKPDANSFIDIQYVA